MLSMLGYRSRLSSLLILSIFLILSSASPRPLLAQSTAVPLPPSAKLPKPKVDRPGFPPIPQFKDIAQTVGLTVAHLSNGEKRYIIESMSGGAGLFDCDDDGRLDIVTVNGSTVDRYQNGGDPMVTLYHQEPDGTFKDITKQAGLTRLGWGMGVAVADYDNDGKLDLFVTGYGGNVLYHNLGNCKFEDVTEKAGVRGGGFSTGAAWGADYDRDGNVDLFVSRYVHVDIAHMPAPGSNKFCLYKGLQVQKCGSVGPGRRERSSLSQSRRRHRSRKFPRKLASIIKSATTVSASMWSDYDNDGWPDLVVANDSVPNYLYHNNRNGTFSEVGMLSGISLSGDGTQLGNMGVDFADYDHSGRFSVFITTFQEQPKALWRNTGTNGFEDVSWPSGVGRPSYQDVCWGTSFFDMANTGWLDLLIACGHVYPQIDSLENSPHYRQPIFLERNNRDGTFDEVAKEAGLADLPLKSRRGAAFGDIFNTGNIDVVLVNVGEPPTLLVNQNATPNHRVLFKLIGTKSNRAAIGARVTIHAAGVRQIAEVRGGGSYLSQNDLRLHFGLGKSTKIDTIEIRWPSGKVETLESLPADSIYTIVETSGMRDTKPFHPFWEALPAPGTVCAQR